MDANNIVTLAEWIFLGAFVLLVFGVPFTVMWLSYSSKYSEFDFRSLWEHKDRKDPLRLIIIGSWWLHSCSMILWTLMRVVSTTDWVTYQLWALPIIAKIINDAWAQKNDQPQPGATP